MTDGDTTDAEQSEQTEAPEETHEAEASTAWRDTLKAWRVPVGMLGVGLIMGALLSMALRSEPAADTTASAHDHTSSEDVTYTCSMHPQVESDTPGTCPICGMDLVPAKSLSEGAAAADPSEGSIRLSERAKTLAQIRTTEVRPRPMTGTAQVLHGEVVADEATLRTITPQLGGRIERLRVRTTGERVRRGQPIATLYSPEVYAAHRDLIAARAHLDAMTGGHDIATTTAQAQVRAAMQRLKLLGLSASEVEEMAGEQTPRERITIRSDAAGTVLTRHVQQGDEVRAEQALLTLADLESVWVELEVYPADLERLREGMEMTLGAVALPGFTHTGPITFLSPTVDPVTQVAIARVEVPNPSRRLRPGMRIVASMGGGADGAPEVALAIPDSAPLFMGETSLVYVARASDAEGTVYEGREVVLGPKRGGLYPVTSGLARGERVVTHGAFAIDADVQLRNGLSLMERLPMRGEADAAPPTWEEATRAALRPVASGYLDIQEALANDDFASASQRADSWRDALADVKVEQARATEAWGELAPVLEQDAQELEDADDLDAMRRIFSDVTQTMRRFFGTFGNVTEAPVRQARCPMAGEDEGDIWFQRREEVDNVYFGNEMRRCGSIEETLEPDERLEPRASTASMMEGSHEH